MLDTYYIKQRNFNLRDTFSCGQCFRWTERDDGYIGIASGNIAHVRQTEDGIALTCDNVEFWRNYFDLQTDYGTIADAVAKCGDVMRQAASYGSGIRILRQQPWETMVSFIISANNNIARISKIIAALCELYGEKVTGCGVTLHSFPVAQRLAALNISDLAPIKCGFRDKYIMDAAQKVSSGDVNLDALREMATDDARRELKRVKGIGDKVADCILMFGYHRFDVFPKDVWIKRTMAELYGVPPKDIDTFAREMFGEYRAVAQQYLFHRAINEKRYNIPEVT